MTSRFGICLLVGLCGTVLPACLGPQWRPPAPRGADVPPPDALPLAVHGPAAYPTGIQPVRADGPVVHHRPYFPNEPRLLRLDDVSSDLPVIGDPVEIVSEPQVQPTTNVRAVEEPPLGPDWPAQPPVAPPASPPPPSSEEALITAIRAALNRQPEQAVRVLAQYEQPNQDILIYLMPLLVRLTESSLHRAEPQELSPIVEQLTGVIASLQPRVALRIEHLCFCRKIRRFGDYETLPPQHTFQGGEVVELYAELRNFTCERLTAAADDHPLFSTHLASTLEIRDDQGQVVWRQDFDQADRCQAPPRDYFHHYRFCLPTLPPGSFVLSLTITDRPTGRTARQALNFHVGRVTTRKS